MQPDAQEITRLLREARGGSREAADRLLPLVYRELHRLARRCMSGERPDHTLQPTALVNELYLRLFGTTSVEWQNRAHFYAVAARQMRQILVDWARAHSARKRGGEVLKVSLDRAEGVVAPRPEELIALDEALGVLEERDARASQVVEMRFFGGLAEKEIAEYLGVSVATVKRDWEFARAWLFGRLQATAQAR